MLIGTKYSASDLENLEAWRGLLSVLVLIAHLNQAFIYPIVGLGSYVAIINGTIANISVLCFFVLSGMLISYSGMNLTKQGVFDWKKYSTEHGYSEADL